MKIPLQETLKTRRPETWDIFATLRRVYKKQIKMKEELRALLLFSFTFYSLLCDLRVAPGFFPRVFLIKAWEYAISSVFQHCWFATLIRGNSFVFRAGPRLPLRSQHVFSGLNCCHLKLVKMHINLIPVSGYGQSGHCLVWNIYTLTGTLIVWADSEARGWAL